jgi:hypothetical protein
MNKPTSRVIQLSPYGEHDYAALCEDGSIWLLTPFSTERLWQLIAKMIGKTYE